MPLRHLFVYSTVVVVALLLCSCRSDLPARFSRMDQPPDARGGGDPAQPESDLDGALQGGPAAEGPLGVWQQEPQVDTGGEPQQPVDSPFAPDTLYAWPLSETAAVGEPVRIVVATGVPAGPLAFMNGCAVSFSGGAVYVPDSFNLGAPGGAAWEADGIWPALGADSFIEVPDFMMQSPYTAQDDGLTRLDFNVTPLGGGEITSSAGELFSFEATFDAPGTYTIGFVEFMDVKRTYYSDWTSEEYFWGDVSNEHDEISNTITVQ